MSDQKQVRVRFAPSPTGFLHVGGARTALFNWLYARNQGGVFVLRIEDTDRERSTAESYAAILRSLEWLGLGWDEGPGVEGANGPYLQSERLAYYREQLAQLIAAEHVYRCYCTGEDLDQREQAAKSAGGTWDGYDGHCRSLSEAQRTAFEQEGRPFCWRLRTPDDGVTFWYDLIVGKREFQNGVIVDRVVVKADGFPTYNYAAAVDDHLMGITHVLRGDDHVSNTPFQLLVYEALGWPLPKFGHMPMILGPDRKRLSKRHGATSVEEFRDQKILPAALVNYLALLGWSIGAGGDEVLTRDQLVKKFSLKKVNSSPAAFDYDKLDFINAQHLKRLGPAERRELTLPILSEHGWQLDPAWLVPDATDNEAFVDRVLATLGGRFSNLQLLSEQIGFFFTEEFPVDQQAWQEHVTPAEARQNLALLVERIGSDLDITSPLRADAYEAVIRSCAEELQVKAGVLIHPCRLALTGQTRSAGIFEVMELVGGPRVLERLHRAADA